jgi:hypothetical protein
MAQATRPCASSGHASWGADPLPPSLTTQANNGDWPNQATPTTMIAKVYAANGSQVITV